MVKKAERATPFLTNKKLHKIRKQINEYVLLNSKAIKLHMKYENIILNIYY
jgi:hypothetical protein